MAGKVPPSMEKLRTKTEYELANDPLGLSPTAAEKIVNRLLGITLGPQPKLVPEAAAPATARLTISSTPPGADIEVDGVFLGSTPSDVTVAEGPRVVRVTKKGFKPYERTILAQPNGAQRVAVELDPIDSTH
jgi:hypothetical protein